MEISEETVDFETDRRRLYSPPQAQWTDPTYNQELVDATQPHIESFNTFIDHYLPEIPRHLDSCWVDPYYEDAYALDPCYTSPEYLQISVSDLELGHPIRQDAEGFDKRMFPWYCRNAHCTYGAPLYVTFLMHNQVKGRSKKLRLMVGTMPVMVRSNRCHLSGLQPGEMARAAAEDVNEVGGYFVINGNERCIRFVIQQRTNYPIAIRKPRLKDRDLFFTEYAVLMRCMRTDGTSTNNIAFFTEDEQCCYRVLLNRAEYMCPFWVLLRALMPTLQMEQLKQKLFGMELLGENGAERTTKLEFLWQAFVDQEAMFTEVDKYEDRHLAALGKFFYDGLTNKLKPGATFEDAGRMVINRYVLVHTDNWNDKFETLLLMYRKLLALVHGDIPPENVDSFAYQELIGPGQMFASILKEALYQALVSVKMSYNYEFFVAKQTGENPSETLFEKILMRAQGDVAHRINYFMATGNVQTYTLDLQQLSGWTVMADRLNIHRFLAHFRAVHRGQFFAQMRTTEVRKLLGETWGFLCPVHTPDGGPCGLLLHMSQSCVPVMESDRFAGRAALKVFFHKRNVAVNLSGRTITPPVSLPNSVPVVVDGVPICHVPRREFDHWVKLIRQTKMTGAEGLPVHMEIAAFKKGCGAFEGIFLFCGNGRCVRPVRHLQSGQREWIGPLAQPWMNIACLPSEVSKAERLLPVQAKLVERYTNRGPGEDPPIPDDFHEQLTSLRHQREEEEMRLVCTQKLRASGTMPVSPLGDTNGLPPSGLTGEAFRSILGDLTEMVPLKYTHLEMQPTSMLSITSTLTPFSNHNQSPRNMYQCQMLKQTMGTPFHNVPMRTDNKSYRLLFPQRPIVRTSDYRKYDFDEYASGTNAIVAVIAYTGYDMEDAMILNKSSVERGFCNAVVYKQKLVDSYPASAKFKDARNYSFSNRGPTGQPIEKGLDVDGFAPIGTYLTVGSPLYRTVNVGQTGADGRPVSSVTYYKDSEPAYVEKINLISPVEVDPKIRRMRGGPSGMRASIKLRCVRNPIVGDKFASRAGQKGICSMLMPHEDMPFTGSGIVPDLVFNPHGFPSRMTVGMLVESMAGKVSLLEGRYSDCSPFRDFPLRPETGVKWTDEGGYKGWVQRGGRYMTPDEKQRHERDPAVDYFGKELLSRGYQYYGYEPMHSGFFGGEMTAHIFIGSIYYQRLRHMVSDKWQVRSTGPIDSLTHQPIKGRKRGGGIRFGEMERDSMLAHGCSAILQDRLMHCSDEHKGFVCPKCGSLLSPALSQGKGRRVGGRTPVPHCRVCDIPARLVSIPYVFRYVCNELAAMNVTIRLQLSQRDLPVK
ncbi:MAG: hypothetical protein KVP17_003969 [Porospora cf. gigantea B]|uniref:uncharacterized protein n=1 Tax=Porospora cf. gigantea B TaxID=2853592 RepID=UPI003571E882|nr:MAG: hypothetical protein KVP17_003969 [Porospora cf. gigantea B]